MRDPPDHYDASLPDTGASDPPAREPRRSIVVTSDEAAGQLWAGHFQHLGTLSLAATAGVLVLIEADIVGADWTLWAGLAGLVASTATAVDGEFMVIDSFTDGPVSMSRLRLYRILVWTFMILGAICVFASSEF